ncbi:MAG: efflux RND transporter periplasmic adaptor subunit [Sulfuricurvum sp.]|nr:efflux RND transporter periplasmic adaptor subunit [Sulfuricurvum sp.]
MKKLILWIALCAVAFGTLTMSSEQVRKLGITVHNVRYIQSESMGPFIGTFDYGDEHSYNYTLSTQATVVNVIKKPGDIVTKGEAICRIASAELLSSSYELHDIEQRLKLAQEYAKKDAGLYKDGVLSLRDTQKSNLEVMTLKVKAGEVGSRFTYAGADIHPSEGMVFTIRAKRSGILTLSPLMGGDKIEPFVPYLKISDTNALNAVIMIPPKFISAIKKGSSVLDKENKVIGKITSVSISVNRLNNSGAAMAHITNPDESFRAGTSAEMYIAGVQQSKWVLLPRASVSKYKNKDICFVRTSDGFAPKTLEVQKNFRDYVAVSADGFTPKTQVVVEGIIYLKGLLGGMGFE